MSLWWLSFADPQKPEGEQFLGVALVEAETYPAAIRRAWQEGCNPGGEIEGIELRVDEASNQERVNLAKAPRHTLMQKDELAHYDLI